MSPASTETPPQLQPPGAGLPTPELWVARLLFGWQFRRSTRASAAALFARERATIRGSTESGGEAADRRVLIKRLPGMEDSSRYWSVFMTLDHLRIVNRQVGEAIRLLGRGEVPPFVASTATVKPRPDVDGAVVGEYENACDFFGQCVAGVANLRTPGRLAHPWFGPLDAAGWHFMAAFHQRLHRKQIEAILRVTQKRESGSV